MYDVAVCDDWKIAMDDMAEELKKIRRIDIVECFEDIGRFWQSCDKGNRYDVVFMDIDWQNGRNGIDYAAELYLKQPEAKVIFVTGYSGQYIESVWTKSINIEGYLSKPLTASKIESILDKIENKQKQEQNQKLVVQYRSDVIALCYKQIVVIESELHHVKIHTTSGVIEICANLSEILEKLPDNFYCCHRSYVINMDYIQAITKEGIYMEWKKGVVPISRLKRNAVTEAYIEHVGEKLWQES